MDDEPVDRNPQSLPADLERYIFEMLAVSWPVSIPTLVLVAARVKEWLEPLLYRTLVIGGCSPIDGLPHCNFDTFRLLATERSSLHRDSVRNIIVKGMRRSDLKTILTAFVGVVGINFEASIGPRNHRYLGNLPLRSLYLAACDFVEMAKIDPLQYSCFVNISHLELFEFEVLEYAEGVTYTALAALPRLTHLSFIDCHSVPPFCAQLLDTCQGLCALVLPNILEGEVVSDIVDPRFVAMSLGDYAADWQRGILLGDDYWARADTFIAKRISRELPRDAFYLNDSVDGNE
ncbi:hypothetical protein C8R43DRAFT_967178 [Mycena crocata]|nr:hypothetical protein C8R43DRAFT_967178 [Mycena crocata]